MATPLNVLEGILEEKTACVYEPRQLSTFIIFSQQGIYVVEASV